MQARSALFDVYGDSLRRRNDAWSDRAPVAALVRLLAPLGIAAPAVRTGVSRMVRQGWLMPVRFAGGPGYALTSRGMHRLDDTAARVYRRPGPADWDRRWHLVVVTPPDSRAHRDRLAATLSFFGYGALGPNTWIASRRHDDLDSLLDAAGTRAERFTAAHDGDSLQLIRTAWDLDRLSRAYRRFLDEAQRLVEDVQVTDEGAFTTRIRLVHAWRNFLFRDPGLPAALLPPDWPGAAAAGFFDAQAERLLPAAMRYVDACLPDPGEAAEGEGETAV